MIFDDRKDISISFSEYNTLKRTVSKYDDSHGPTVIQAYQDGYIEEEDLIELVSVLEINGYPRRQLYDLPYAFALRIVR